MRISDTSDLWWKTAVVYCLDVQTFMDWNDDGMGDFAGLAERIDYLSELGVTCLWLMPFYPTADRDDGYDITDYYGVDPRLGSSGDFVELVRTARDRGMRVIIDLVLNHTSDRHPWFRSARASKGSPYRDFYVWRADEPPDTSDQVVFPDKEDSIWEYDEKTEEWYLHRFYRTQPDLNITNPLVRDEIAKTMGFWLELGISGFRVDAVPFMIETTGVDKEELARFRDPHAYLRMLRSFLGRRTGDGILLGEVNLPHKDQQTFFGGTEGDELSMQFDFIGMQNLYLSLARQDARPLAGALKKRPDISQESQWATFVRNHDELTLDKLRPKERDEVFAAFGPEPEMQMYGRGLRRRLPTMLDGDPRRIRMAYSLLFSLPGTPVLFYGEEIGMGENLDVPGRLAVRTPMQWSPQRNGGFSGARPSQLRRPLVTRALRARTRQRRRPAQRRRLAAELRHAAHPPISGLTRARVGQTSTSWSSRTDTCWRTSAPGTTGVSSRSTTWLPTGCTVALDLDDGYAAYHLVDLLQDADATPVDDKGRAELTLDGYGYRWLRLVAPDSRRMT